MILLKLTNCFFKGSPKNSLSTSRSRQSVGVSVTLINVMFMDGRGYLNRKVKLQIYNFVISACSYGFLWVRSQWAIANNEASNHFIQIMILEILSWRAGKEITGLMFGCSVCSLVYYYVEMLFCPIPIKIVSLMHALSIWMINECLCIGNTKYLKILWDYYFIM